MTTVNASKDIFDLPEWRPLASAPNAHAAGGCLCSDMRNSEDRHPTIFQLASAAILNEYHTKNDGWSFVANPGLAGTFGAGADCVFVPYRGPQGTLAAGSTTTKIVLSTALPAAVGANQLAGRGDGRGFKIRIIGNTASSSGKVEERLIVANTAGATPTLLLDSPLSFTPATGDAYEFLSGRVYLLGAGTVAAGTWKAYDVLTNSMLASLATTNLPATISIDSSLVALDEQYVPCDRQPGDGFFGKLTAAATTSTTLTGHSTGGDSSVLANEYRNFQIRIVEDTVNKTAVGQRRKITSHTAGVSPVYTVPAWTVTPSANAMYVIEYANEILLWTSNTTTTYTYAQDAIGAASANTWSTTTYGARGGAAAAGCSSFASFGLSTTLAAKDFQDSTKSFRYSNIFSFRGGGVTTLDVLDIAGAATGSWTAPTYGAGPTFTTGTSIVYDNLSSNGQGRFAYINNSGTQVFHRFNVYARNVNSWPTLRFPQGTAAVGNRMAMASYHDTEDNSKHAFPVYLRSSGTEFFQIYNQR